MAINFAKLNVTTEDRDTILKIVQRAKELARNLGQKNFDALTCTMDLTVAHHTDPLALDELLKADNDGDFAHDVWGIMRHIDRETGELGDHFSPRYAACYHNLADDNSSEERFCRNAHDA
jgi:hypothetical protein